MPSNNIWTRNFSLIFLTMLVAGTGETLFAKWADRTIAVGTDAQSEEFCKEAAHANVTACRGHKFQHPFLQSDLYFVAKVLCLIAYNVLYFTVWRDPAVQNDPEVVGNQNYNRWIIYPAALCKIGSSSTFYVGLNITYASSSQMFSGAGILFTALLSIVFLKARLYKFNWFGLIVVISGLITVGLNDVFSMSKKSDEPAIHKTIFYIILGDAFIIASKLFSAMECTYEQALLKGKNLHPIQITGWEGIFGFVTVSILLVPLYFCIVGEPISSLPSGRLEDVLDAFAQARNRPVIFAALACTVLATGIGGAAEAAIVKLASATTSQVLNTVRASTIWMISLALHWQTFGWLQVVGFVLIILGTLIYSELFIGPTLKERFGVTAFSSTTLPATMPLLIIEEPASTVNGMTSDGNFSKTNLLVDEENQVGVAQQEKTLGLN